MRLARSTPCLMIPLAAVLVAACEDTPSTPPTAHRTPPRPRLRRVQPGGAPIQVARPLTVIIVHNLASRQTRICFASGARNLRLRGRRLAWAQPKRILTCTLPGGQFRIFPCRRKSPALGVARHRLAYATHGGSLRVLNLEDGSSRDYRMFHGHWLYLGQGVLAQSYLTGGRTIKYARLESGEIVDTGLRDHMGHGIGFRDGTIVTIARQRTDKGKWEWSLVVLDTASGERRRIDLPYAVFWPRFVGGDVAVYGGPRRGDRAFRLLDLETGSLRTALDCDHVEAHYGVDSNGRQVAWGYEFSPPREGSNAAANEPTVWVWDSREGPLREVSAEARANLPPVKLLVSPHDRRAAPDDAAPRLKRRLGRRSVQLGSTTVAWIEHWSIRWSAPH